MEKEELLETVEDERRRIENLAMTLWETPELALEEHKSVRILTEILEEEGFSITLGIGGMETAFVAEYGDGKPRIGVLGEYDALPGLSQSVSATREAIEKGGPGHGCGHNLFGAGSFGGALAIKRAIDSGVEGTIRFYGCPAEETLVGKVYMAREGVFDDLDAALAWHPSRTTSPFMGQTLAMNSLRYTFNGEAAHAANSPESGRSALDAVQLMNTGAEYMREHIVDDARIHYSIVDGGSAPNVVPATAEVWYYVRSPTRDGVEHITNWLDEVAEGAAMMSQTDVDRDFVTGCYSYVANERLSEVVYENLETVGLIPFEEEDRSFARDLKKTLSDETVRNQMDEIPDEKRGEIVNRALYSEPLRSFDRGEIHAGSTEVGDVSWITPTAQFWAAAWPVGTPSHTWQAVAANGSFAPKTAVYAAKVLAGIAYDLLMDASLRSEVREEFERLTADSTYESPLPPGIEPPTDVQ